MNVKVHWHDLPHPRKLNHYIKREADKLGRHLPDAQRMNVRFFQEGQRFRAKVQVEALGRQWWVQGEGHDLWTGMAAAVDHLLRLVQEFKGTIRKRHRQSANLIF